MENNTTEPVVVTSDVEQPNKPKREKPIPGRKRGVGKKPFEEKVSLQSGYWLQYYNENAMFQYCVVFVEEKQQRQNYIDTSKHYIVLGIQKTLGRLKFYKRLLPKNKT